MKATPIDAVPASPKSAKPADTKPANVLVTGLIIVAGIALAAGLFALFQYGIAHGSQKPSVMAQIGQYVIPLAAASAFVTWLTKKTKRSGGK
jgi:hypothetical protein